MKKLKLKIILCALFFVFASSIANNAQATPTNPNDRGFFEQGNFVYQPLAPIPGVQTGGGLTPVNLEDYLGSLFKIGIGLCAVFAVLMIVIGGLEYVMTDKIASKEDAKTRITNALVGLLLALSSYILLYTINPELVKLNFLKSSSNPNASIGPAVDTGNQTKTVDAPAQNPSDKINLPQGAPDIGAHPA
ncbi:MAG: hypothetical protein PHV42_04060 [Candidatus Pacebacteria bacterium]|nr:hypothetical protein [Candidatus Paceibacterota bacterium]